MSTSTSAANRDAIGAGNRLGGVRKEKRENRLEELRARMEILDADGDMEVTSFGDDQRKAEKEGGRKGLWAWPRDGRA